MAYLDYEGLQHFKDKENEQIAPVENGNTSANAYAIGKYFWHEGNFCEAKTAIAVGDAFVQNTNYTIVKVGDELEKKAYSEGEYDSLTAGNANQLVSTVGVEDNVPYNFRTSGGSVDIGNREQDKLIGGTIAWNQLGRNGSYFSTNYSTKSYDSVSGETTFTPTVYTNDAIGGYYGNTLITDHIYLSSADFYLDYNGYVRLGDGSSPNTSFYHTYLTAGSWANASTLFKCSGGQYSASCIFYVAVSSSGWTEGTFKVKNAMVFDLTKMLGNAVANYLYSIEQAHSKDGVMWFKKLFPNPYYAYDTGTLMSVRALSHDTVGFNAWDGTYTASSAIRSATGNVFTNGTESTNMATGYIRVVPSMEYYFNISSQNSSVDGMAWYDADKQYITGVAFDQPTNQKVGLLTAPYNACYMRTTIPVADAGTANINLSWSGYRNGEHEPYEKHTYALDPDLELRGLPKLATNNDFYYDGDIYESNGNVTRKYGIVDLGLQNWIYSEAPTQDPTKPYFYCTVFGKKSGQGNIICSKYAVAPSNQATIATHASDKTIRGINSNEYPYMIYVRDSGYTDATTFKTAMSGQYLVYELMTPTEETADQYTEIQVVNDFGTEEYVDAGVTEGNRDVSVPVGHDTFYQANLRDKVQNAPNSPSEDGDYVMRRSNGDNEYVPMSSVYPSADNVLYDGAALEHTSGSIAEAVSNLEKASFISDKSEGYVASFSDGANNVPVKDLTLRIEPNQPLHGKSKPLPPYAGNNLANLLDMSSANIGVTVAHDDYGYVQISNTGTVNYQAASIPSTVKTYSAGTYYVKLKMLSSSTVNGYAMFCMRSVDGNLVRASTTFSDSIRSYSSTFTITEDCYFSVLFNNNTELGSCNIVLYDLMISTTDSPYVPYQNICPISGWIGAKVTRTGKNIAYFPNKTATNSGITYVFSDGVITASGTANGTSLLGTELKLNPGTDSIANIAEQETDAYVLVQRAEGLYWPQLASTKPGESKTFTITEKTRCAVRVRIGNGKTVSDLVFKPILIVGSEPATEFEPYNGKIYNIEFPTNAGTVYGGTLDVTTGQLIVDYKYGTIGPEGSGSDYKFSNEPMEAYPNTYVYMNYSIGAIIKKNTSSDVTKGVCSHLPSISRSDASAGGGSKIGMFQFHSDESNSLRFAFPRVEQYSSLENINTWLQAQLDAGTPFSIAFPLESTTEYTLSPTEIKTILGINNIYMDAGYTETEYNADTKLYIQRLTGDAEDDMIANENIASGQYFMVGNRLLLATEAIAIGETIVIGSSGNCTETTLAEALNAINS